MKKAPFLLMILLTGAVRGFAQVLPATGWPAGSIAAYQARDTAKPPGYPLRVVAARGGTVRLYHPENPGPAAVIEKTVKAGHNALLPLGAKMGAISRDWGVSATYDSMRSDIYFLGDVATVVNGQFVLDLSKIPGIDTLRAGAYADMLCACLDREGAQLQPCIDGVVKAFPRREVPGAQAMSDSCPHFDEVLYSLEKFGQPEPGWEKWTKDMRSSMCYSTLSAAVLDSARALGDYSDKSWTALPGIIQAAIARAGCAGEGVPDKPQYMEMMTAMLFADVYHDIPGFRQRMYGDIRSIEAGAAW